MDHSAQLVGRHCRVDSMVLDMIVVVEPVTGELGIGDQVMSHKMT